MVPIYIGESSPTGQRADPDTYIENHDATPAEAEPSPANI